MSGWLSMLNAAPSSPKIVSEKMPSRMKPMCATDENAMTRLMSVCMAATIEP